MDDEARTMKFVLRVRGTDVSGRVGEDWSRPSRMAAAGRITLAIICFWIRTHLDSNGPPTGLHHSVCRTFRETGSIAPPVTGQVSHRLFRIRGLLLKYSDRGLSMKYTITAHPF